MKTLTVKVIGKTIKDKTHEFTVYSLLTSKAKWYRTAGIDVDLLADHNNEIATIEVSRLYNKKVTKADGKDVEVPTLVIESIREANEAEKQQFNAEMEATNAPSLADL